MENRKERSGMRRKTWFAFAVMFAIVSLWNASCKAEVILDMFGKPLTLMGYVQQTVGYGIENGRHFDTKDDFQSFLFQGLLEAKYEPDPNFKIFVSGKVNTDWAYPIFDSTSEWRNKGFDKGRDDLYFLHDSRDLLGEAHITWTPGNFYFRAGKQIVVWGETDGFKLMDQINPVDQRRGMGDVQFESSVIPLWLLKAEYNSPVDSSWVQELGYQIVFNPNLEFRGNERIEPGNERYGIWAANGEVPMGGPYPFDYAHLGSWADNDRKPDGTFETEGMEIGARLRAVINDAIVTLNGFYGRDNDIVRRIIGPPITEMSPFDNRLIFHLPTDAYYPILRFVGATFSRDFPSISSSALGGVAPTWRAEAMYVGGFTNGSELQTFEKSDEIRWMVGLDWKIKVDFLNPKAYFFISPQFYHRHIVDYANSIPGMSYSLTDYSGTIKRDNYTASILINTSYFHTKLQPMFFWLQDISGHGNLAKVQVAWEQDYHWKYILGAMFVQGTDNGVNFEPLKHKDQAYLTVQYRF
jgi:hypothetical protein